MKKASLNWLAAIAHENDGAASPTALFEAYPLMPWITPRVHPAILDLVERLGTSRRLLAGEFLFGRDEKLDKLVIVTSGVSGRSVGDPRGQGIAIATPGHIAAGNLNFFSERHAFGQYFAITDCEYLFCSRKLLFVLAMKDPELMALFATQFECCALSDRLGMACLFLMGAKERLAAFTCSWALNYGQWICREDGEWIRMPVPLSRQIRSQIINVGPSWIDRTLRDWRAQNLWQRERDTVYARPSLLEPAYRWLRDHEESDNRYSYPKTLAELFSRTRSTS